MNTLILSCNTGEGHNSCAKAIKEYYDSINEPCEIYDAFKFISSGVSEFMSKGHAFVYRNIPWLFNNGYRYTEKHPEVFDDNSIAYRFLTQGSKKIYDYIKEGEYDSVICTHVLTALMLTDVLKKYSLNISTAFVATDYTCSPSTKQSTMDYYFIPDKDMLTDFECEAIPESKIIVSGIPVRQIFYDKKPSDKQNNERKNQLLVMCGSMGCGPMKKIITKLSGKLPDDWEASVVCGRNKNLYARLSKKYKNNEKIKIYGYVTDIGKMMDEADLYLTKPGGISVTEAAAKNLPMILIDAVAGCEEYNRIYFTRKGCAKTAANTNELIKLSLKIMNDKERRIKLLNAVTNLECLNSSEIIYKKMKEKNQLS